MYDTIIIGAGPAGMTAALYAARSNLQVALLERGVLGGQMNNTANIENYPGYSSISGPKLAENMFYPLEKLGVKYLFGCVTRIEDRGSFKKAYTEDREFKTKTIVLATGANHRRLGILGEETFNGRGVSYCAVCDGIFFRDKNLLVVGGGDSAIEEAIFLTRFARTVTVVHRRSELRAQQIIQNRAFANEKIKFIWNTIVIEIKGNDHMVTGAVLKNIKTKEQKEMSFGGIFIYVGLDPINDLAKDLQITDEEGWVMTDQNMKTGLPGVFAVGDVRQKDLRQIVTAVSDGAIVGKKIYEYIAERN